MTGPFDHPWLGGLFGDAEAAALWGPDAQITHMLAFEAAFTRALGATGKIDKAAAEATARAIETFRPDLTSLKAGTAQDGVPVPDLVRQLREAAGGDPAHIHSGATSQDVIDTALALTLRAFNDLLAARLTALSDAFAVLDARWGTRPLMGRTRMQAALPVTFAHRLATWADPLARHQDRLDRLRPQVEQVQLGGPVGDRAALGPQGAAMAGCMAALLGLQNPDRAWHATRDALADYGGLLSLITGALGKFGQDICLMAQQGIDEAALAQGGGSSAMAHKNNPVGAELLVTLARFNATQLSGLHQALVHEQERSGAAWTLEWMILPQMAQTTARSLGAAADLCGQITRLGGINETS